jgi:hypothetical protein
MRKLCTLTQSQKERLLFVVFFCFLSVSHLRSPREKKRRLCPQMDLMHFVVVALVCAVGPRGGLDREHLERLPDQGNETETETKTKTETERKTEKKTERHHEAKKDCSNSALS